MVELVSNNTHNVCQRQLHFLLFTFYIIFIHISMLFCHYNATLYNQYMLRI